MWKLRVFSTINIVVAKENNIVNGLNPGVSLYELKKISCEDSFITVYFHHLIKYVK